MVLPRFWVPDTDGDQYQTAPWAHFEAFESLFDPGACPAGQRLKHFKAEVRVLQRLDLLRELPRASGREARGAAHVGAGSAAAAGRLESI